MNSPHRKRQPLAKLTLTSDSLIILTANEAFARTLGVRREELIGRSILPWISAEERKDFSGTIRMARRHPMPHAFFHWNSRSGSLVAMQVMTSLVGSRIDAIAVVARPAARRAILDASVA